MDLGSGWSLYPPQRPIFSSLSHRPFCLRMIWNRVNSLLDPAHVPVSHDKTQGGGNKENAGEINFDVRNGDKACTGMVLVLPLLLCAARSLRPHSFPS